MQHAGTAKLIDIRDIRELQREGRIDGAFHAPRGMLEFWADPDSPYHKDIFATQTAGSVFAPATGAPLFLQTSKIWEWIIFGI